MMQLQMHLNLDQTMKIFTLAAAINEGVYKGQDYYQSGTYQVGNRKIRS